MAPKKKPANQYKVTVKKPKAEFWRCGQCWTAEPTLITVVDCPKKLKADHSDAVFVTPIELVRLQKEAWLDVAKLAKAKLQLETDK